ncbi:MAG: hypothetical protein EZS28_015219, partial [Streblomastix strix]
ANPTTNPLTAFAGEIVDDSNYVKKTGQELQIIHGVLRRDDDELSMSEYDEDYLTRAEIYNAFVSRYDNQTIYGTKTFNTNVNAVRFAKIGKDDTSVLLACGGDRQLSQFGGIEDLTSSAFNRNYNAGTFNLDYLVYIYLDEALLDAAGLSDFPELYAYIHERYQEPVPFAQAISIGKQTLQKQVKDNDDTLNNTNEVFVPPVSNAPTKLDLSSQLERSSFLAIEGSDPQLIVYGDRVTLSMSYEITGLFLNGYLFKSYPEFVGLKGGGQDDCIKLHRFHQKQLSY